MPRPPKPPTDLPVKRQRLTLAELRSEGRPYEKQTVPQHIRDMCQAYTEEAVLFYASEARNPDNPIQFRKSCYDELMNRGYGRPKDEGAQGFDGIIQVTFVDKQTNVTNQIAVLREQAAAEIPAFVEEARAEVVPIIPPAEYPPKT